jgi:hypothetical protein
MPCKDGGGSKWVPKHHIQELVLPSVFKRMRTRAVEQQRTKMGAGIQESHPFAMAQSSLLMKRRNQVLPHEEVTTLLSIHGIIRVWYFLLQKKRKPSAVLLLPSLILLLYSSNNPKTQSCLPLQNYNPSPSPRVSHYSVDCSFEPWGWVPKISDMHSLTFLMK